jgi:hypothetical protein
MNTKNSNISKTDPLVLFRQATTSMSAGLALMLTGILTTNKGSPSQLLFIGFGFFCLSFVFLIAALIQLKWHWFPSLISQLGDGLTVVFIIINIATVIKNWADIIKTITESNAFSDTTFNSLQPIISYGIPIWIEAFAVIILIVLITYIIKGFISSSRQFGFFQTLFKFLAVIFFCFGIYGIIKLSSLSNINIYINRALLVLCIISIIGSVIYLYKKTNLKRKFRMEDLDKIKESAAVLVNKGKFIYDSIDQNYPLLTLKETLEVPLKRLEAEIQIIRAIVDTMKE